MNEINFDMSKPKDRAQVAEAMVWPIRENERRRAAGEPLLSYWGGQGPPPTPVTSYVVPKDPLKDAQYLVSVYDPKAVIKTVKIDKDTRPATQAELDAVQLELAAVANDPDLVLVMPPASFDGPFQSQWGPHDPPQEDDEDFKKMMAWATGDPLDSVL